MSPDFSSVLDTKQFFRFTGPPEHWLTAVKYMTWGLEEKHREKWKKIQTGDIFFIHSSAGKSSAFSNAESGIIGIGVVGFDFSVKDNNLWRYEMLNNQNRWPLLVPLTEMYLFSELPDPAAWESPTPTNDNQTTKLIDQLVSSRVRIGEIKGFPQMGSFSGVSRQVAEQILSQKRPLYVYSGHSRRGVLQEKGSNFIEAKSANDTLRHAASLRFLEQVNQRLILKPFSLVKRDNDILARAEKSHYTIVQGLIDIFRAKGYETLSNQFVDLFAHDGKRSFLFEVKSTENRNFRSQARKGIVQLYEYDYFEVGKFKKERGLSFEDEYRILVPSQEPTDNKYIEFINNLDLGVAMVDQNSLKTVGHDFGFSKI